MGRIHLLDDPRRIAQRLAIEPQRRPPREELIDHGSERVDVGPRVDPVQVAAHLLRAHRCQCPDDLPLEGQLRPRPLAALDKARHAEVENLGIAVFADQDIRGLEVAVDDTFSVRILDGLAHLCQHCDARPQAKIPIRAVREDRPPLDPLHREVGDLPPGGVGRPRLVDARDRRVLEARQRLRLELESPKIVGSRHAGPHDLQCHNSERVLLLRLEDDSHAPFADLPNDPKPTYLIGGERIGVAALIEMLEDLRDTRGRALQRVARRGVANEQRSRELVEVRISRRFALQETLAALFREVAGAREEIGGALVSVAGRVHCTKRAARAPKRGSSLAIAVELTLGSPFGVALANSTPRST